MNQNNPSRPLVVVGFAEALAAPEVVWSLVDDGFDVVAFARKGKASALRHSRHVTCHEIQAPDAGVEKSVNDLQNLLHSLESSHAGPRFLFPMDDTAVWLCNQLAPSEKWVLAGPTGTNAELTLNKCHQTRAAEQAGFNVPKTIVARTAADIFNYADSQSLPIILKAAECIPVVDGKVVSCRKWICADRSELERAVAEWKERVPLLVQPFILGTGEGVFGLATPTGIRALSAHRRLRMMNPQGSGSSACISQAVTPELQRNVEKFIANAQWRGLFMIELLRDDTGKVWFVEINGRPWGSMSLARRQKLEYPAWHMRLAMDSTTNAGLNATSSPGVVCRNVGREFMHMLFVLKGSKSKAITNWPPFLKTVGNVLHIRRGDTFYNWRREDARVFMADCYYTIHSNIFKSRH